MRYKGCFWIPWYYEVLENYMAAEPKMCIHVGVSGLVDLGRGSPEYALPASLVFARSCGCKEGPGLLSGLLVLVNVSRVVT
jgi:hypothetical protein